MNPRKTIFLFPAVMFLGCVFSQSTIKAQTTLMNVPSTDVVAAKKVYVEMDFLTNYAWQRQGSFQNYIPRAVVGVGHNLEAGVNVSYTRISGEGSQPLEVQPNIKWQFYSNEGKGTAAAVGCVLYTPVTHRTGTNTLGQCYAVASKKLSGKYGTRFTGGAYGLIGAGDDEKTKAGAIVGYEQPLTEKVLLIVDWFSGDNRFGYVSPGLSFTTSKKSALTTGYTIANHGRGKNALF
ncbi:MAG: hypothetical protein ACMG6H_11405, partial [Acidobacteriota bacterium]